MVKEYLEHDPTIWHEGTEYTSIINPLYEASESGDLEVVRIILKCGIGLDITNTYGYWLLHVDSASGI